MRVFTYLSLGIILNINLVNCVYHCRAPTDRCKEGRQCQPDGTCTCPDDFEGYNCQLEKTTKCSDDESAARNCMNGGICYETNKCYCPYEFVGENCEQPILSSVCRGTGADISIIVPDRFRGEIASTQTPAPENDIVPDECKFTSSPTPGIDGRNTYTFTIPFDGNSPCTNATLLNSTDQNGDTVYEMKIVQTYNTIFTIDYDKYYTVKCIHRADNFTLGQQLGDVDLNKTENLQTDEKDKTYSPVRMRVLDKDDNPLQGQVQVGEVIKLQFYLDDESVYKSLRMEECTANDTRTNEEQIVFNFLKNGCPTEEGESIMVDLNGQKLADIENPRDQSTVSAADLEIYAFKFKSTGNVGFNCQVKICREGEDCKPKCGADAATPANDPATSANDPAEPPTTTGASARRKRRATTGVNMKKTFSAVVSVVNPFADQGIEFFQEPFSTPAPTVIIQQTTLSTKSQKAPSTGSQGEMKSCFRSQEILIVIIVMSAFVFVLLVACLVMSCTIIRLRNKFFEKASTYSSDTDSNGPRFFLPRAKMHA